MHNGTHASLRMRHKVSLWPANFVNHSLVRILAAVRVGETLCDVYTTSCWCLEKNHTRFWFELCFDSVWNGAVQSLFSTDTIELSKYVRGTRGAHDTRERVRRVRRVCVHFAPSWVPHWNYGLLAVTKKMTRVNLQLPKCRQATQLAMPVSVLWDTGWKDNSYISIKSTFADQYAHVFDIFPNGNKLLRW